MKAVVTLLALTLFTAILTAEAGPTGPTPPGPVAASDVVRAATATATVPGPAPDLALGQSLAPAPQWLVRGTSYQSCFCNCRNQRIACINSCWSCTPQCYDQEYACQDQCIAQFCSAPGSCMDPVTCF
jgi:hypothetical protein